MMTMVRKGHEQLFNSKIRSLSLREDHCSSIGFVDFLNQSCWANLPSELLRDVLARVEASESTWPTRKTVVSCAGVCRSWREMMKELVKTPEVSHRLTFPISLKQPGPRRSLLRCYIKRNCRSQTYFLYLSLNHALSEHGKFLLTAKRYRRPTYTDYVISINTDDVSKRSSTYVGKLRSNFLGTRFTVYDSQPPTPEIGDVKSRSIRLVGLKQVSPRAPAGNYPVAHIGYELNVLGSRGPRKIQCMMDSIPASCMGPGGVAPTQTEFTVGSMDPFMSLPFFRSKSRGESYSKEMGGASMRKDGGMLTLRNRAPRWHEQLQCWCLNFNGRVTVASVKNFQLVAATAVSWSGESSSRRRRDRRREDDGEEEVILQFGKVGTNVFTMDYGYPISAFQAFAICLSSFDTKIACE